MQQYTKHIVLTSLIVISLIRDHYKKKSNPKLSAYENNPTFTLQNPYTDSNIYNCDIKGNKLINTDFELKLKPEDCDDRPVLLIIIVPSNIHHYKERKYIRETWGSASDAIKLLFIVGLDNYTLNRDVISESDLYKDIAQGNFMDSFRNLTYKHMMGLKWVAHHCTTARYILKVDEDVFINYNQLIGFLTRQLSPWGAQGLIACTVKRNQVVVRSNESIWQVTEVEYEPDVFPSYCWRGFILYSQDVIPFLVEASQTTKYLFIEDVYSTGIVAQNISVSRTDMRYMFLDIRSLPEHWKSAGIDVRPHIFGPYDLSLEDLRVMWKLTH